MDLTVDNIATALVTLIGSRGIDWEFLATLQNEDWWMLKLWIERN